MQTSQEPITERGKCEVDPLEMMLIERSCTRLVLDYARHVDSGHASRIADLFTIDGVWLGADGRTMAGRDEIRAAFTRREQLTRRTSRHVCTNVIIDVQSDEWATGSCYLINFRHDADGMAESPAPSDVPKFVGEYRDRYRRIDGSWLIAHRSFELTFLRAGRRRPG